MATAVQRRECPRWVKSGSPAWTTECPLLGEEQTSISSDWMSAYSRKETFEINEAAAGPVHLSFTRAVWCYSPAVSRGDRPVLEKWSP